VKLSLFLNRNSDNNGINYVMLRLITGSRILRESSSLNLAQYSLNFVCHLTNCTGCKMQVMNHKKILTKN
jgi:hypothetical protein